MKTPSFNPKDFSTGNIKITIGNTPSLWQDVRNLRKKVFCEEEGFGADMIETDTDPYKHSPGTLSRDTARSGGIPYSRSVRRIKSQGSQRSGKNTSACRHAPPSWWYSLRKEASHYSILMLGMMYRHVLFPAKVRYVFLVLDGIHCSNEHLYQKGGAFQTIKDGAGPYGRRLLMLFDSHTEEAQKAIRQFNEMWVS